MNDVRQIKYKEKRRRICLLEKSCDNLDNFIKAFETETRLLNEKFTKTLDILRKN